jgi:hypothetical protein
VVQSDVQTHLLVRESGETPHPPEGSGPVEGNATQLLTSVEKLALPSRRVEGPKLNVLGKVDCFGVDPEGRSKAKRGPVEKLAEAGEPGQTTFDVIAEGFDPERTGTIEQTSAVEDGDHTDVLGPAVIVGPEHGQVG